MGLIAVRTGFEPVTVAETVHIGRKQRLPIPPPDYFEDEKSSFFVDTLGLEPKPSDGVIRHTVTPLLTIL